MEQEIVLVTLRGPMRKPSFLGMEVFFIKQFKTLDEQLIIVHNRNLRITDYKRAKQFLLTNNYLNIILNDVNNLVGLL